MCAKIRNEILYLWVWQEVLFYIALERAGGRELHGVRRQC